MSKNVRIINIGRQFGSGGRLVAAEIGRILGIPVYDNELITKAAEESGFSKELFAGKDEKRSLFSFSSFFSSGRYSMSDNYLSDNELFKMQGNVIRKLAEESPCIFIGRCSDYILRDRTDCLDIFICAPMEERIKLVCERENLSREDAEDLIIRKDRTRRTYYDYFTLGDWGVASNYDLCVDSSILGIEGTARFIVDFKERLSR